MKKISVTYKAPPGDSKVAEAHGHTFYDGQAKEIDVDDDVHERLKSHRHFELGEPDDDLVQFQDGTENEGKKGRR